MPPEFNKYEILRKIGEGAQGEVYLAKDKRLGRKLAIKSLHVDLITNTVLKERFIREAQLLGQLNHPSIVTLFDYIADNSGYHLIMEYLKGNQLDDYIRKVSGPITEIRAIDIFLQVLDGVHHIHKLNIVHRDIKPSNIIIDENDKIKLLDFGIAVDYSNDPNLTRVGQNVGGTPMYMSPEHVLQNVKVGVYSDIYSLGVTFWHMLTGKEPYEGENLGAIYSKIEKEDLPNVEKFYPAASKKLNDIIKKATAKDPKKRYDSCFSFIRDIKNLKKNLLTHVKKKGTTKIVNNAEKNVELRVVNVDEVSLIVNHEGHIGTEYTFTALAGTKLDIKIHKDGYQSIYKEMIINEDELIEFKLKKRMPAFISLILVVFYFFIETFFKIVAFFVNKKILKLNELKTNNIYENIDKANDNLNNNINSVKTGILEISSFFGIILIIILIFTFSIDNSESNYEMDGDTTTVVDKEKEPVSEIEPEPETEPEPEPVEPQSNFPARGTKAGQTRCDSNGYRIDTLHDGNGGTYRRKVYDTNYCPIPNSTSSTDNVNSGTSRTSGNSSRTSLPSEFKAKFDSNDHDFYTNSFNGWQLLIEISGRDIKIRVYKNGNLYHTFNERGRLNDLWFDRSDNTLVTNRSGWSVGKKQHRITLNNKQSFNSMTGGILYNGSGFTKISLIPN